MLPVRITGPLSGRNTGEARPGNRNYFDNIAAATDAGGYYLFLNARDKDGRTKRLDKYNWTGVKQWSTSLADTSHYQSNRPVYKVISAAPF